MWKFPSQNLVLSCQEVQLWRASLDIPSHQVDKLATILSEDEQLRAQRFYFEKHKHRFIVARGLLRKILASYLGIAPEAIQFQYSAKGKPSLAMDGEKTALNFTLNFNISHSQGFGLYGFTRDRLIGVDIEYINSQTEVNQIAQRYFSDREYELMKTLSPLEQKIAFFRGWTAKEAYLKAIGSGIGDIAEVEVALSPQQQLSLLSIRGDRQAASQWSLVEVEVDPEYQGAAAVEGHNWQLSCWETQTILED